MEYYVFSDQTTAQSALDYINAFPVFPIIGQRGGNPDPAAQPTVRWCDEITPRDDGKWVFPRIPSARLDAMGVTAEQRLEFFRLFSPAVEEEQPNWWLEVTSE